MEQLTLFDENTVVSFDKASSCRVNFHQIVDTGVMRIVPETPLAQVHNIFRQLGVKLILIVRGGMLVGIITKKQFVDHLHGGHIAHLKKPRELKNQTNNQEGIPESVLMTPLLR